MTDTLILRTRPTHVEARQFTADSNVEELARWVGGWTHAGDREVRWFDRDTGRVLLAEPGDWIVRTAFGHHKPVSDSMIFTIYEQIGPT